MTGMKPAHEQSFDFDDYAYAQAPGSHGGGIDGENAFVPPRYVFYEFLLPKNHRKRSSILKIRGLLEGKVFDDDDDEDDDDDDKNRICVLPLVILMNSRAIDDDARAGMSGDYYCF
jgi:hypothetical protein